MVLTEEKINAEICPNCNHPKLTYWRELSPEEKMTAERIPRAESILQSNLKHCKFCTNCWFIESAERETFA